MSDMTSAAVEIRNFMFQRNQEKEARREILFEIRIVIHTGPLVGGIVGIKKFAYDIGVTRLILQPRMESSGEVRKVNISGTAFQLVNGKFKCVYHGKIEASHKKEIDMYFAERNCIEQE